MVEGFHFLRPLWLLALPVAAFLLVVLRRAEDPRRAWKGVIDAHLLEALLVVPGASRRVGPIELLGLAWLLTIVALAGPSWRREPAPFAEDTAALVVVVKVTPTMTSKDVQPTRLARATQKVDDLMQLRTDVDCALLAYAGSVHRVMPLTRDGELIAKFAASLAPEIMPLPEGDACAQAIALANEELRRTRRSGSIVLIADAASADQIAALDSPSSVPVHVLGIGTPSANLESLRDIAQATGGSFVRVSPDDRDVQQLADRAARNIGSTAGEEDGAHWRDEGYWLVPAVVLLALFWSRRGWTVALPGGAA